MKRGYMIAGTILCAAFFIGNQVKAQTNIPANTIVAQNFNSMTSGLTLPLNWKVSLPGAGLTTTYASGVGVVTQAANSGTPTLGGAYNWGTAAGTDRAVGFLSSGSYANPNAVMGHYRNITGSTVTVLTVSFSIERYRINTSAFNLSFFSSTDGIAWTARTGGDISSGIFAGAAAAYSFGGPQIIYKIVSITGLSIANNADFYFRWVFTDADAPNAQGLGLDNVSVYAGVATPVVTATLRDLQITDNAPLGQANSGDDLRYTTVIKNIGSGDANNVVLTQPAPTNTTLIPGSVKTSALAKDESYTTSVNTALNVGAPGVLSNDYGLPSPTVVSFGPTATSSATAAGVAGTSDNVGTLTVNADGSLSYTPPSATFAGIDKFSYKASNGNAPDNDGFVTISVGSPAAAVNDAYNVIGNVQIQPSAAQGLFANDGVTGQTVVAVNGSAANVGNMFTTANGSNITVNANGSFTYNPGKGFDGPTETFTYTVDNGFASPQTATVTLNISGMVWFIDNAAAPGGDGRIATPFNTIGAFQAVNLGGAGQPADNDNIFIYENGAAYVGSLTLRSGQKLYGQDASVSLSTLTTLTPNATYSTQFPAMNVAAPATTLTTTAAASSIINLIAGSSNTVRGLTLGDNTGYGIASGGFGTLIVSEVLINTATAGGALGLTNGTLAATFTNITSLSSPAAGIAFNNIGGSFVASGTVTITGSASTGIDIQGSAATINFSGTTNVTKGAGSGSGVGLSIPSTRTVTFNALNITATAGIVALSATGPGTLATASGTISAVNNSAINTNTIIFGAGSALTNVTASGGAGTNPGIRLTSVTGTMTVGAGTLTGNSGSACFDAQSGTVNFTYNGAISQSTAGSVVFLSANTGGTIAFGGAITGTGSQGIILNNNAGVTMNFSGGMTLNTGTNAAFSATVAGTVNVTGTNNITTTTGTGLNLANVTVGASGATFATITTNGAANGVNLNTVTGTVTINGGTQTGSTTAAFNINGGTVSMTYSGAITQAANAPMVFVSGGHGTGTLLFQTGTLSATNGSGFQFDNADGTYNFNGTNTMNTGDAGIDILNGSTGTFSFSSNSTITNPSATAFNCTNSNANVTYSGSISDNSGLAVNIDNHDAGTMTFQTGNITSTGTGINVSNCGAGTINFNNPAISLTTNTNTAVTLASNTGSTINFTPAAGNGLDIVTTSGTGFSATGGGTITVTGTGNTITSPTGTALNVTSTTISGTGLTFQSISSSSAAAPNGIIMTSTGAGGLTVTGTGSAGSGGTISGKTGADGSTTQGSGIYLSTVSNISLSWMNIQGNQNHGIRGNNVTGFTLDNSTVGTTATNGTSNVADVDATGLSGEGSIRFYNLLGSATISNSTIDLGFNKSIIVSNDAGTLNRLTLSNCTVRNTSTNGDALYIQCAGTSTLNYTITGCTFNAVRGFHVTSNAKDASTMDIQINSSAFSNTVNPIPAGGGLNLGGGFGTDVLVTFNINGNSFRHGTGASPPGINNVGRMLTMGMVSGQGKFDGKFMNNTIGVTGIARSGSGDGADGIGIFASGNRAATTRGTGTLDSRFLVQNNIIKRYGEAGILINARQGNSILDVTVLGNTINEPGTAALGAFAAVWVNAGALPADVSRVDVVFGSATVAANKNTMQDSDPSNATDVFIDKNSCGGCASVLNLYRNGSGAAAGMSEAIDAQIIVDDNNGGLNLLAGWTNGSGPTIGTPAGVPPVPPLLFASGGVKANAKARIVQGSAVTVTNSLSDDQLKSAVEEAIRIWEGTGLSKEKVEWLRNSHFYIDGLAKGNLGNSAIGSFAISPNADGKGWYVGTDKDSYAQFNHILSPGRMLTSSSKIAAGRVDLLTCILHEMGHILGLKDLKEKLSRNNIMYSELPVGERRLPTKEDVKRIDSN